MKTVLSRRVEPQKNVINPSILQAVRPRKKYPMAFDNVVKNIPENQDNIGARPRKHQLLPSVVATKSTEARLRSSIRSGFFKPSYFPITANSIQFKNIESRKTICEPFDIMTSS